MIYLCVFRVRWWRSRSFSTAMQNGNVEITIKIISSYFNIDGSKTRSGNIESSVAIAIYFRMFLAARRQSLLRNMHDLFVFVTMAVLVTRVPVHRVSPVIHVFASPVAPTKNVSLIGVPEQNSGSTRRGWGERCSLHTISASGHGG